MSEREPILSVLMPTHLGERWLGDALGSLAAQVDRDVEVVLVDSSPDDATLAVAERFAGRIALRIVARPEMRSWTAQTNLAATIARGRHLAMLHQDDLWLPGRMPAIRGWIADAPDAVLHVAPSRLIDVAGRAVGRLRVPADERADADTVFDALLVQNFVSVPSPVIRRDAWAACGGLDEGLWYTADWDLGLKLSRAGAVRVHAETTAAFRIHPGSQTVKGTADLAGFRAQLDTVLDRHGAPASRRTRAAARASIAVNTALAGGLRRGAAARLAGAGARVAALGPAGIAAWFHHSRIVDRLAPRLRARLAGAL